MRLLPPKLNGRKTPDVLYRGTKNKVVQDLFFRDEEVNFPDGYKLVIDSSENMNRYQFFNVSGRATKKFTDKNDPSEITERSGLGKEIGSHINELTFNQEYEDVISHLQEQREFQVNAKADADNTLSELEASVIDDMIEDGKHILSEFESFGLLKEMHRLNSQVMLYNDANILLAQLSNIGTLLGRPMSIYLIGEPSEGKSTIEDLALKVIDKRHIIPGNIMTLASVYRGGLEYGKDWLDRKIIQFGDQGRAKTMERNEEARDILKALATEGYVAYHFYDMEEKCNKLAEIEGYTSMILSSPQQPEDEQELSRGFIIHATRVTGHDVLERIQLNRSKLPNNVARMDTINDGYERIKNVVEYIISEQPLVYNPFQYSERELSMMLRHEKRQITSIGMLIEIVTILNKEHRKEVDGVIISNAHDVEFVYNLLEESNMFKHNMEAKYRQIHDALKLMPNRWLNKHEIAHLINWKGSIKTIGNYLSAMSYNKYLEVDDEGKAHLYKYMPVEDETVDFKVELRDSDIEAYHKHFKGDIK